MFARALVGSVLVAVLGIPSAVHAQAVEPPAPSIRASLSNPFLAVRAAEDQLGAQVPLTRPSVAQPFDAPTSSQLALRSLYAATATMQLLDVHSTMKALSSGAVEANPLMSGLVQHRAAFVAAKASVAAVTIYAANKIARNNKVGAIATMIAMNSAYAFIVANNYRNARR